MLLLFKNEACSLLRDNWHTRRVMRLDGRGKSKEERLKEKVVKGLMERMLGIA